MSLASWLQGALPAAGVNLMAAFQAPPMTARPMLRWWWPHGLVDPEEIKAEVQQMYDAGFGGAEIEDVHRGVYVEIDPSGHGWGTDPWIEAVQAASDHAKSLGFKIDNGVGPSYPAAAPTVGVNDEAAGKELATGRVVVTGGQKYEGAVPSPYKVAEPGVTNSTLLAVHAYKVANTSLPTAIPVILEQPSLISLTCKVKDGKISFTPPDNGTWLIISFTMRGSGQFPEGGAHSVPNGAVIDHFTVAGMKAVTNFWDNVILNPKLKAVLSSIGGSYFEDSIELEYSTLWTPNLRAEFKKRMGYDLFRYLPAVTQENQKLAFAFQDPELNRGVINDFWDTLGQMYIDNHVSTIKPWANAMNMKYRAQVYGLPTMAMNAAAKVDIPEGESLGFKNLGDYRSIAGPANFAGQNIRSNEAGAFAGSAYSVTWDLLLQTLNPIFTAGVNMQVLHGFSYKTAPETKWPGFAAFTPYGGNNIGYAESWGPRIPLWKHASDVMGYFSRIQYLIQVGIPKHDVVFFEQKGYIGAGYNSPWFADSGVMLGYSLNIIGPGQLEEPTAKVVNKRLHPDGPAYKIFAFEQDTFASAATVMSVANAEKILSFAKSGLGILIVGNWSVVRAYGRKEYLQNDKLTSIFAEILAQPSVVNVATRADIPAGVTKLGILPDVQYNAQLINYHRVDGDLDHYLFVASHPATYAVSTKTKVTAVEADVLIPRRSSKDVPLWMDLWTGEVTPIAKYEEVSDTQIRVHISLDAYQACMITIAPLKDVPIHASTSDATAIVREDDGLYLRANATGSFTTKLSTGESVTTVVDAVPAAFELKGWTLDVQDWQPTSDIYSTDTVITNHTLTLDTLSAWPLIPELADVSGVGTYRITFTLASWPAHAGAVLNVPIFVGSMRLTVNGKRLPPVDQLETDFDIGKWLKDGENTLEIEVATTLLNRLRVADTIVYGIAKRQDYGLISPITIKPYVEKKIAA